MAGRLLTRKDKSCMITEELELAAHDELPINDPLDGYVREDHLLARLNVHQRTLRRAGPPRIRVGRHVCIAGQLCAIGC